MEVGQKYGQHLQQPLSASVMKDPSKVPLTNARKVACQVAVSSANVYHSYDTRHLGPTPKENRDNRAT